MSNQLPNGWITTPISALCEKTEQRIPANNEVFTYIDISSIDRENKKISGAEKIIGEKAPSRARKVVNHGDIIVSMTRPNLNAVALVGKEYNEQIASTGFDVLRTNSVDSKWIFFHVRSQAFIEAMCEKVQGALYPAVKSVDVRGFIIPLPPLAEQKEIAILLDNLLAQVDTLKTRLDAIPNILKRFRQSVLAAAVSGKLTEEWRDIKAFDKFIKIGEIALDIRYGTSKKCDYDNGSIPVLRIPNIATGSIDLNNLKFADFEPNELENLKLKKGDLLLIRSNGSVDLVGKTALITEKDVHCLFAGYLIRIRFDQTKAFPKYIVYCLQSPRIRQVIEIQARSTSGVNNINSKEIATLELPFPPIEEQKEIVRRVEELFAFADQIEQQVKAAQQRVNHLTQAILAKAFRGELTAQWREQNPDLISGENSAAALLARIKESNSNNVNILRHSK